MKKQFSWKLYPGRNFLNFSLYLILIICLVACEKTSDKFKLALKLSGDNKKELEKVIRHYSKNERDTLKLKAAYFLIENMPGHHTIRGEKIDKYRERIERDSINSYYSKKLMNIVLSHFVHDENSYRIEDVQSIKADYLIHHINVSFELFERFSWLDLIPFDCFLEYVLPYRFTDEPIDYWRDSLQVLPHENMKSKNIHDYFVNSFIDLKSLLSIKEKRRYNDKLAKEMLDTKVLGDCYYIAYDELLENRILGIPSMIHYIPFHSDRNGYHYWRINPPLLNKESDIAGEFNRRSAKVFRRTFTRNNNIQIYEQEYIPDFFKNPFIMDVTDFYFYTTDIKINVNEVIENQSKYGYLCTFNESRWKPIAIGKIEEKIICFNKISKNLVYLPVYFKEKDDLKSLNYPFILKANGKKHDLIPNTHVKQTISLNRKYPILSNMLSYYYKNLVGTIVEASNNKNFDVVDTLFVFRDTENLEQNDFQLDNMMNQNKYRWYRVCSNNNCQIAEIYIYNSKGEFLFGEVDSIYNNAFDRNPLTNIELKKNNSFTIDFKKPVTISKLYCLPRNDGNGIYPDNTYELLYWDMKGWHSLGAKTTVGLSVKFENAPTNALFWLRNITIGFEERIFTYENDIAHFW